MYEKRSGKHYPYRVKMNVKKYKKRHLRLSDTHTRVPYSTLKGSTPQPSLPQNSPEKLFLTITADTLGYRTKSANDKGRNGTRPAYSNRSAHSAFKMTRWLWGQTSKHSVVRPTSLNCPTQTTLDFLCDDGDDLIFCFKNRLRFQLQFLQRAKSERGQVEIPVHSQNTLVPVVFLGDLSWGLLSLPEINYKTWRYCTKPPFQSIAVGRRTTVLAHFSHNHIDPDVCFSGDLPWTLGCTYGGPTLPQAFLLLFVSVAPRWISPPCFLCLHQTTVIEGILLPH